MAKGEKETGLATQQSSALTASLKQFSQENEGLVQVRSELLGVPRLVLTQKMSKTAEGLAQLGEFACGVKSKNFGTEVTIIPVIIRESASFIDKDTSELICRSDDLITNRDGIKCRNCPYTFEGQSAYWNNWGTKEKMNVPACKASIDVICLVGPEKLLMELSFRKMSYKAGRALVNFVVNSDIPVPFGSSYKLKSRTAVQGKYTFAVIEEYMEKKDLTEKEIMEIIPIAKKVIEMHKSGTLERDESIDDEVIPPASGVDNLPV